MSKIDDLIWELENAAQDIGYWNDSVESRHFERLYAARDALKTEFARLRGALEDVTLTHACVSESDDPTQVLVALPLDVFEAARAHLA